MHNIKFNAILLTLVILIGACAEEYEVINIEEYKRSNAVVWMDERGTVFVPKDVALIVQRDTAKVGIWHTEGQDGEGVLIAGELASIHEGSPLVFKRRMPFDDLKEVGDRSTGSDIYGGITVIPVMRDVWVVTEPEMVVGAFRVMESDKGYSLGSSVEQVNLQAKRANLTSQPKHSENQRANE